MHPNDGVPLLGADREDHPVAQDTRVVDEHVDVVVRLDRPLHETGREVPVADVTGDADRLAAGRDDLCRNRLGCVADVVDDNLGTGSPERERFGPAQADTGTRDDGDAAFELAAAERRHQRLHHGRVPLIVGRRASVLTSAHRCHR